jgi:cytochrome c-type biogenesis protein CcmH/NrfF
VIDFLVARYGEFVLLKPRFNPHTLLLWLLPPLALGSSRRYDIFRDHQDDQRGRLLGGDIRAEEVAQGDG